MVNVAVCIIDKKWCEYETNQMADYAVNLRLIKRKSSANNGCFNIVVYTEQQQNYRPC